MQHIAGVAQIGKRQHATRVLISEEYISHGGSAKGKGEVGHQHCLHTWLNGINYAWPSLNTSIRACRYSLLNKLAAAGFINLCIVLFF